MMRLTPILVSLVAANAFRGFKGRVFARRSFKIGCEKEIVMATLQPFREYVEKRSGAKLEDLSMEDKMKWRGLFDKSAQEKSSASIRLDAVEKKYIVYLSNRQQGQHSTFRMNKSLLVAEAFPYVDREDIEQRIADQFLMRLEVRKDGKGPADRTKNPLIAVTNGPGVGKSAFLANFVNSAAYQLYVNASRSGQRYIAVPITFNSAMEFNRARANSLGLRVLFSALIVMADSQQPWLDWEDFYADFSTEEDLTLQEAIKIIRKAFGARLVLLLVDELSKSFDDKAAINQIGEVLNHDGDTDVVVSSLSPQYITTLLIESRREIVYVYIPPLLNSMVGVSEMEEWVANRLKNETRTLNPLSRRIMSRLPLFCSGIGRHIQFLLQTLRREELRFSFDDMSPFSIVDLASKVSNTYGRGRVDPQCLPQVFDYVLSGRAYSNKDSALRGFIESGDLMALPVSSSPFDYRFLMPFTAFVSAVCGPGLVAPSPIADRAVMLLKDCLNQFSNDTFSTMWERAVCLGVVCHSRFDVKLETMFGVAWREGGSFHNAWYNGGLLSVRYATQHDEAPAANELLVAAAGQPGYVSSVRMTLQSGRNHTVYVGVESKSKSTSIFHEKVAGAVRNIIAMQGFAAESSSIVFYVCDHVELPTKVEMLALIDDSRDAVKYVNYYYDTNVYAVSGANTYCWLPPTLWTFSRLVQEME